MNHSFLLTIDVEDWFQVENFKRYIPFAFWSSYKLRVEKNTHRLLDFLDSVSCQPSVVGGQPSGNLNQTESHSSQFNIDHGPQSTDGAQDEKVRGTFFVLGWIAERLPHLIQEIHSRGHEVASHGYYHNLCNDQSHEDLKADLCDSKSLLEDIIGNQVYGYRAPSFAINNDILKIIEDCGYLYDSSYNSFSMHGRYGHLDLLQNKSRGIALKISKTRNPDFIGKHETRNTKHKPFYELPVSNLKFAHQVFPWGGGGYFRLIPFPLFKIGVKFILGKKNAYLFYFHPWEIDPEQPKVNDAPVFYKFLHYINLRKTHIRLSKLIENFAHCNFITCRQYLDEVRNCTL